MSERAFRFRGHVVVGGELICKTGLHIGGNRDSLVIGGHDLPVARDPATRLPIVPGSSLRGRLRALLEMLRGRVRFGGGGDGADGGEPDALALLFGRPSGRGGFGPSRLLVRDALPVESEEIARGKREKSTLDWWRMLETDGLGTEVKAETAVNRVTAAATPRHVERVLAGSRFRLELVLGLYDYWPDEEKLLKDVLTSLALLEDSYLGGHGSRGYGRVEVRLHDVPAVSTAKDYESGRRKAVPGGELKGIEEIDADRWIATVAERLGGSSA
ncbi:MAG: type III-A CRISPR-associated RAMP protein Csm3 [Planctomycetota bacterium JB042]